MSYVALKLSSTYTRSVKMLVKTEKYTNIKFLDNKKSCWVAG